MPIGKYFCDYCDKQFQDTWAARKRHLSGIQHQRNRALWYDSLKDTRGGFLLQQPGSLGAKGVCHHFVRTGSCKYGDTCNYCHPTQNVPSINQATTGEKDMPEIIQRPNFFGNPFTGGTSFSGAAKEGNAVGSHMGISWGDLPPSLRPPPEGGYPPLPFVDWG